MPVPARPTLRSASRPVALLAVALVAALLAGLAGVPAKAAATSADPVTSFAFTSDPGEYVGQGQSRTYTPAGSVFGIQGTAGSVTVSVDAGSEWWDVTLAAPAGAELSPGSYQNVGRAPFNNANPGLSVTGTGRGCNTVKGLLRRLGALGRQPWPGDHPRGELHPVLRPPAPAHSEERSGMPRRRTPTSCSRRRTPSPSRASPSCSARRSGPAPPAR